MCQIKNSTHSWSRCLEILPPLWHTSVWNWKQRESTPLSSLREPFRKSNTPSNQSTKKQTLEVIKQVKEEEDRAGPHAFAFYPSSEWREEPEGKSEAIKEGHREWRLQLRAGDHMSFWSRLLPRNLWDDKNGNQSKGSLEVLSQKDLEEGDEKVIGLHAAPQLLQVFGKQGRECDCWIKRALLAP